MTVTVNSDPYRAMLNEFLFTKIEVQDIGNKRTVLRATQPKLPLMFHIIEVMSFGHLGAVI